MVGGVIIKKEIRRDASYITGVSFSAFLPGGDIFAAFILFFVIVIISLILSFKRKKKTSEQKNRRVSSIKRELKSVKEKASYEEADIWIKDRLDEDIDTLDSIIILNKK